MRPRIYLATNLANGDAQEDIGLATALREWFRPVLAHPLDLTDQPVSVVVIRNVWPTHEYQPEFDAWCAMLRRRGVRTFNPLVGRGDQQGKGYLVRLYADGHPVIPTFSSPRELRADSTLAWHQRILEKPFHGSDGSGQRLVPRHARFRRDHVYQPYLKLRKEVGIYFLDDAPLYAIARLHGPGPEVIPHRPSRDELAIARRFVRWNALPYGLQRVDLCYTVAGDLYLLELEDSCPCLWLNQLPRPTHKRVQNALVDSIRRHLAAGTSHN